MTTQGSRTLAPVLHRPGVMGRPPIDPAVRKVVIAALAQGGTRRMAHRLARISYETFYEWMKTIPEFAEAVQEAESKAAMRCVRALQRSVLAEKPNTQAAAFFLERHPQWGDEWKQRMEITAIVDTPDVQIADSELTDAQIEEWIAEREGTVRATETGEARDAAPKGAAR